MPTDEDNQIGPAPTSIATQYSLRRKRRKTTAPSYQHFASAIRQPEMVHCQDNTPEADISALFLVRTLAAVTLVICIGSWPGLTLRLLVLAETVLFAFPPFFSRWPVLIAMLLPMRIKSLLEVVIGLALFSWTARLDWRFAWGRVGRWIRRAQKEDAQGFSIAV